MLPKKRKSTEDDGPSFNNENVSPDDSSSTKNTQTVEALTSQMAAAGEVKVEKEEEEEEDKSDLKGRHSHQFTVKFPNEDLEYTIDCDQPRTVLDAIKLDLPKQFQRMTKDENSDSKIIIQLRKRGKESIVATHFPCSCIKNGEYLIIYCKTEEVEETKKQHDEILPRDRFSVFYISTQAGIYARKEKLFKSSLVKEFDHLCVYAKKGTSVKEALEQDGRFVDLEDFKLSEVENSNRHTVCTQKVDNLDQKKFKICQDRKTVNYANEQASSKQQKQKSTSQQSQQKLNTKSVLEEAKKSGISVKRAIEETNSQVNTEEIYKLLREQFQYLKRLMESRFSGDSYQKALEGKKENFGKIQQSFSAVHRVKKLLKLGESVCKVIVSGICQGTGFVLFDRLILTNAHLFEKCVKENKLQEGTDVYVLFNYDEPEPFTKYNMFTAEKTFIDFDLELDYAILELSRAAGTGEAKVPPGLLSKFGPPPATGEACLIGHPAGEEKQIDPTCIIPMDKRNDAVDEHLHPYKDTLFIVQSINHLIQKQDIESIMMGGSKADKVVTYNTFMYHGASGSPVFDAECRVFGLHTAGYVYGFPKETESVIEFAVPLLTIFEEFESKLKNSGNNELLERVQEARKGKSDLDEISEGLNDEEEMEIN